ncbi:single-stranded-DNA-specific exonuclease RecJ [Candidatus Berkelbacteria bacterium]|nr:single-stranded-DNA-specific exonuclease RecJ [Candidatus Berkelbacteria bacterium]
MAQAKTGLAKVWQIVPRTEADLINQLLKNRGITDRDCFFNPDYERDSHDPYLMPNMEQVVARILKSITDQEKIVVYGDYDADGIPGTALLVRVLRENGALVEAYIPDREKEGYGLNNLALDKLKENGVCLVITVDLGITNKDQASYAKKLGLDLVITDHHHVDLERLPTDALAIVHPALPDSDYPFKFLAGGGVAWKLAQAISQKTNKPSRAQLKWLLELPAISTVCDIVPLNDENRMMVYFGLKVLAQTRNPGLKSIYKTAGLTPELISEQTLGFQIGPRVNAPGRVDSANIALDLLVTDDEARAQQIAAQVELFNQERQDQLKQIVDEAMIQVRADNLFEAPAIVLRGEGWPGGLIGLAAARVMEKFHRPTILLGEGEGMLKGSGRSIDGFDLLAGIASLKNLLTTYGGHQKAAGLGLEIGNFEEFKNGFIDFAANCLTEEQLIPRIEIDAVIKSSQVTAQLIRDLEQMAPFGCGNPRPSLVVEELTIRAIKTVGADNTHLKVQFVEQELDGIGFGIGYLAEQLKAGDPVKVLGCPEFNVWNGVERIQLKIDDIRLVNSE